MSESRFFDYKTAPVNGSDIVDLHKTGMSFYDDFLNPLESEYLRKSKNLKGTVVQMSPEEYFEKCAKYGFSNTTSVDKLKRDRRRDEKTLDHLRSVLIEYKKKFPMPMLNIAQKGQEGLHRMMVIGDMFGWDHKVPVLVVEYADKQRAYEEERAARQNRIEYNIEKAVKNALEYRFLNLEEVKDQIQWELDKQFEYNDDDIEVPVKFEFTSDATLETFTVTIGAASYTFNYEDVQFKNTKESDDDLDIDDLDLEETEDFLKRYFGDDWRKTHPHLKSMFNMKD